MDKAYLPIGCEEDELGEKTQATGPTAGDGETGGQQTARAGFQIYTLEAVCRFSVRHSPPKDIDLQTEMTSDISPPKRYT